MQECRGNYERPEQTISHVRGERVARGVMQAGSRQQLAKMKKDGRRSDVERDIARGKREWLRYRSPVAWGRIGGVIEYNALVVKSVFPFRSVFLFKIASEFGTT